MREDRFTIDQQDAETIAKFMRRGLVRGATAAEGIRISRILTTLDYITSTDVESVTVAVVKDYPGAAPISGGVA